MPGFLGGSTGSSGGVSGEIRFPAELIDPVTKLRVSEPQTLIDTDFEYGLQPTKWETVELINNTPSFFSASGDTTIPNLVDMITTAGSREVKITTSLPHGLAVGIPINISGTKSLTADGAYIINSIPDSTTFTYLCKQNQLTTASIVDLYTSVITGQFFQGSQIKISDSEGLITNAQGQSTLTLKTDAPHGFGVNTPFYFLNLNSTISQEFDASNTASKTFDSSNTATAQAFDGSNTLTTYSIDLSNKAYSGTGADSTIASVNTTDDTFTVTHQAAETFVGLQIGTPLYYNISASSGYFANNPRGVVFLRTNNLLGASSSVFQVSATPGGTAIDLTVSMTGTFRRANLAQRFAGNNIDNQNQTTIALSAGNQLVFDGANNTGSVCTVNSTSTGSTIIQMQNNAGSTQATGLYVGAMIFLNSTGTVPGGLTNDTTYFISFFQVVVDPAPGLVQVKLSATPGGSDIVLSNGSYSGTLTMRKIGVSLDKDIIHIQNHGLVTGDMVRYTYPAGGAITRSGFTKDYHYVTRLDNNNIQLETSPGLQVTSSVSPSTITVGGESYKVLQFTAAGSNSFTVSGTGTVEFLAVGGGGGGGYDMGGGGGGGGVVLGSFTAQSGTYNISVGNGGNGMGANQQGNNAWHQFSLSSTSGQDTTCTGPGGVSITAKGGGYGGSSYFDYSPNNGFGATGGSGGGASGYSNGSSGRNGGANQTSQSQTGLISFQQYGNRGGTCSGQYYSGGGGGAGSAGTDAPNQPNGGNGVQSNINGTNFFWGGGGGGASYSLSTGGNGGAGGGGGGALGSTSGGSGINAGSPGGGGSPGTWANTPGGDGGTNTGGGGGGGAHYNNNNKGGNGGRGIFIVRWKG